MTKTSLWALIVLPALALSSLCLAQTTALKVTEAKVQIQGDSTMHKWVANAVTVTVDAAADLKQGGLMAQVKSGALKRLSLVVPVDGLQSTESKSMDKNMHNDLDSAKFPDITFSLKQYNVQGVSVTAQGSLSIHGVAKDVTLTGALASKEDVVVLAGSYDLKMSDFGVQPPVMMLGTIKVKDAVTIRYSFNLAQ